MGSGVRGQAGSLGGGTKRGHNTSPGGVKGGEQGGLGQEAGS
jgi:hypothetical protein